MFTGKIITSPLQHKEKLLRAVLCYSFVALAEHSFPQMFSMAVGLIISRHCLVQPDHCFILSLETQDR